MTDKSDSETLPKHMISLSRFTSPITGRVWHDALCRCGHSMRADRPSNLAELVSAHVKAEA